MRNRLASLTRNAVKASGPTVADADTITIHDDDAASIVGMSRSLLRRALPTLDDRGDLEGAAILLAFNLATHGTPWGLAVARSCSDVVRAYRSDIAASDVESMGDIAEDARPAWRQAARVATDGITATTDGDRLLDVLAMAERQGEDDAVAAALKVLSAPVKRDADGNAVKARGPLPRPIAILPEYGEAIIRQHEHERGLDVSGSITSHDGSAAIAARLKARRAASKGVARKVGPARQQTPASGPASGAIITGLDALGYPTTLGYAPACTYLHGVDDEGHAVRHLITDTMVAPILAHLSAEPHKVTPADAMADDMAYRSAGIGGATTPSNVKRKRDGGIGSPTIARGPRHDWAITSTSPARAWAGLPVADRWTMATTTTTDVPLHRDAPTVCSSCRRSGHTYVGRMSDTELALARVKARATLGA